MHIDWLYIDSSWEIMGDIFIYIYMLYVMGDRLIEIMGYRLWDIN